MKTSDTIEINDCIVTISIKNNLRVTNNKIGPVSLQEYLIAKEICNRYEKAIKVSSVGTTLIEDYPFSVRLLNVLKAEFNECGTMTIQDLYDMVGRMGQNGFLRYRNIGKKSWEELLLAFEKLNEQSK